MKNFLSLLLILFLTLGLATSCGTSKETSEKIETTSIETGTDSAVVSTDSATNTGIEINQSEDSLFASISRGACYGTCPIYKMSIYQNGTVILEGIRFMEPRGKYKSSLSPEEMQQFIDKAIEINFFALEDTYDSPVTDIPSVTTSIVIDGKRKEVMRRTGYPQRILKFEQLFDALLESQDWILIEAPKD